MRKLIQLRAAHNDTFVNYDISWTAGKCHLSLSEAILRYVVGSCSRQLKTIYIYIYPNVS